MQYQNNAVFLRSGDESPPRDAGTDSYEESGTHVFSLETHGADANKWSAAQSDRADTVKVG